MKSAREDTSSNTWIAPEPAAAKLSKGEITHAIAIWKPSEHHQERKITKISLSRDCASNIVTVKLNATAAAREYNIFGKIEGRLKGIPDMTSSIIMEPLHGHPNLKVPVLQLSLPYEKLEELLQAINTFENNAYVTSELTIRNMIDSVSARPVERIGQTLNSFTQRR